MLDSRSLRQAKIAMFKAATIDGPPLTGLANPTKGVPAPTTQPGAQPMSPTAPQPMQQNSLAHTFAGIVQQHNQPKQPPAQSLSATPTATPAAAPASGAPSAANAWRGAAAPAAPAKPAPSQVPNQQPSFFQEYANSFGNNAKRMGGAAMDAVGTVAKPLGTAVSNSLGAVSSTATAELADRVAPPFLQNMASKLPDNSFAKHLIGNIGQRGAASRQDATQQMDRALSPFSAESQKPLVTADSQVLANQTAMDSNPVTQSIGQWGDAIGKGTAQMAASGGAAGLIGRAGQAAGLATQAPTALGSQLPGLAAQTSDAYNAANAQKDYAAGDAKAMVVAPIPEAAANNLVAAQPSQFFTQAQKAVAPILSGGSAAIASATKGLQSAAQQAMGNPAVAKGVTDSITTGKLEPSLFDTGWKSLTDITQDPQKAVSMFTQMSLPEQLGLVLGLGMTGIGLLGYFGSEDGGIGSALMALLGLGVAGGVGANALTGGGVGKALGGLFGGAPAAPAATPAPAPAAKSQGFSPDMLTNPLGYLGSQAVQGLMGQKPPAAGAAPAANTGRGTWKGTFANMMSDNALRSQVYPKMIKGFLDEGFSQAEAEQQAARLLPAR